MVKVIKMVESKYDNYKVYYITEGKDYYLCMIAGDNVNPDTIVDPQYVYIDKKTMSMRRVGIGSSEFERVMSDDHRKVKKI